MRQPESAIQASIQIGKMVLVFRCKRAIGTRSHRANVSLNNVWYSELSRSSILADICAANPFDVHACICVRCLHLRQIHHPIRFAKRAMRFAYFVRKLRNIFPPKLALERTPSVTHDVRYASKRTRLVDAQLPVPSVMCTLPKPPMPMSTTPYPGGGGLRDNARRIV